MKVKLLSDTHLEYYDMYPGIHTFIPPTQAQAVDVICLCGDIGDPGHEFYRRFIADCAAHAREAVLVIAGNHEMYGRTPTEAAVLIDRACAAVPGNKAVFLNTSTWDIKGTRFLGTTLWSKIDPSCAWSIRQRVCDFHRIKNWGISNVMDAFHMNLAWLRSSIQEARAEDIENVVVLTHHAPLVTLGNPKYADSPLLSAFCSDLEDFILANDDIVSHWFYGHTHFSECVTVGRTTVMSNQADDFDRQLIIDI